MAILDVVEANARFFNLLLSRCPVNSTDSENGTVYFDVDGRLVMFNLTNKSNTARQLMSHVLEKFGVMDMPESNEVLTGNLDALNNENFDGFAADVVSFAMNQYKEADSQAIVAEATVE